MALCWMAVETFGGNIGLVPLPGSPLRMLLRSVYVFSLSEMIFQLPGSSSDTFAVSQSHFTRHGDHVPHARRGRPRRIKYSCSAGVSASHHSTSNSCRQHIPLKEEVGRRSLLITTRTPQHGNLLVLKKSIHQDAER